MEPRVLFLSASIGAGHEQAARAIAEWLPLVDSNVQSSISDYTKADRIWGASAKAAYLATLKMAPAVYEFLYYRVQEPVISQGVSWVMDQSARASVNELVATTQPQLVVCTHWAPIHALASLRRRMGYQYKIAVVITDYEAHSLWIDPRVDLYFVANEQIKDDLIDAQVDAQKIIVSGIPVRPVFATQARTPRPKASARPHILIMGGGLGLGPVAETVGELLALHGETRVTAVCGRNEPLYQSLLHTPVPAGHQLNVIGFTDRVAEIMADADILITKPGGITTSEALALGVPIILTEPIPGQEDENASYLVNRRVALMSDSPQEVRAMVKELCFGDPIQLVNFRQLAKALGRPYAGRIIAETILQMLRENPINDYHGQELHHSIGHVLAKATKTVEEKVREHRAWMHYNNERLFRKLREITDKRN